MRLTFLSVEVLEVHEGPTTTVWPRAADAARLLTDFALPPRWPSVASDGGSCRCGC